MRLRVAAAGHFRHRDHRFEWTRAEFGNGPGVADALRLRVRYLPVGADDPEVGPPTQLAVFTRITGSLGRAA